MKTQFKGNENSDVEDFPIGSIVIFSRDNIFSIGIVVEPPISTEKLNIIYGEYYSIDKKGPSGKTMNGYRSHNHCFLATKDDYVLSQVEYLISVYNKEKKKNIKLIIK